MPCTTKTYHLRPTFEEILEDAAPLPFTLSAFMDFLCRHHCLETLEFILESRRYQKAYSSAYSSLQQNLHDSTKRNAWNTHMMLEWQHLITTYVAPSSPCEICLPPKVRGDLLVFANAKSSPSPDVLEEPVQSMHRLMNDSILLQFFSELSRRPHMLSLSAPSLASTRVSPWLWYCDTRTTKNCSTDVVSEFGLNIGKSLVAVHKKNSTNAVEGHPNTVTTERKGEPKPSVKRQVKTRSAN